MQRSPQLLRTDRLGSHRAHRQPCECEQRQVCRLRFRKILNFFPAIFIEIHGILPEQAPMIIAPHPATTPAAGVMATRPVIIPWTAPMTEGFLKKMMSMTVQTRRLIAVAMLVLITAAPASGLAAYGSPPLKPFQPIQRITRTNKA